MDIKEIDVFRLDLQMRPNEDCNFSVQINPEFLERYKELRPKWGSGQKVIRFLTEIYKAEGVKLTTDAEEKFQEISAFIPLTHHTDSEQPTTPCTISWNPQNGSYSSKGIQTFYQFATFFKIFLYELNGVTLPMEIESQGNEENPRPALRIDFELNSLVIYVAPSLMENMRQLALQDSSFPKRFRQYVVEEIKGRGKDIYFFIDYYSDDPKLAYFEEDGYLRLIRVEGAGYSTGISIDGSDIQKIPEKGGQYFPHNIDHHAQAATILLIFCLFTEEVRKFHGVDFF